MPCPKCGGNHPIYRCPQRSIIQPIKYIDLPETTPPSDASVYMVTLDEGAGFSFATLKKCKFALATEGLSGCVALVAQMPEGAFLSHIYSDWWQCDHYR